MVARGDAYPAPTPGQILHRNLLNSAGPQATAWLCASKYVNRFQVKSSGVFTNVVEITPAGRKALEGMQLEGMGGAA